MARIQLGGEDDEPLDDQAKILANGAQIPVELLAQLLDGLSGIAIGGHPLMLAPGCAHRRGRADLCTKPDAHTPSIAAILRTVFQFLPVTRVLTAFSISAVVSRERPTPSGYTAYTWRPPWATRSRPGMSS